MGVEGAMDAAEGMVAMEEEGEVAMAGTVVVVATAEMVAMVEKVVEVVMEAEEGAMAVVEAEDTRKV